MILIMMMMILTAWSCSLLASGDCIALDQLDRVFSGFSIFDWAVDQLGPFDLGLPPLVWDLDQSGWVLSGLPFIFILSDQAGRVLSGLSRLNLGLVFLSGLAIPLFSFTFSSHFWIWRSIWSPSPSLDPDEWSCWPFLVHFLSSGSLWLSAYPCPCQYSRLSFTLFKNLWSVWPPGDFLF